LDYRAIAGAATHVFDTRGVYRRLGIDPDNVTRL
jgi:hypothetical protein